MLIIGHRGAAGLAAENTAKSIQAAIDNDVDIVEIDVRLTKDGQLVLIHDARLLRTHGIKDAVSSLTLEQLRERAKPKVPLLSEILDRFYGKILLNIELKSRGSGEKVVELLKSNYIKKASDWDNILITSSKSTELLRIRKLSARANLGLIHLQNPFLFVAYHRFVKFTAVGFHRLYLNPLAIQIAKRAQLFTYTYTVNRPSALSYLAERGIDGIVTNYPDKFAEAIRKQQAND